MEFITLNGIITDLLNVVRASNISASESISKRQIEEWVHQYRSLLLKRDLDKNKDPNPDYIQSLNNLLLEKVDLTGDNLSALAVTAGVYLYRTKLKIPKTIDLNHGCGFTYIGTPDGEEIQFVPEGRSLWQKHKKYTPAIKLAFLRDEHIYVVNSKAMEALNVRGIFEVPTEVSRFTNPQTSQGYTGLNDKYPIPAWLVPALKKSILDEVLKTESDSKTDTENNGSGKVE